jgi:hypothetical protein
MMICIGFGTNEKWTSKLVRWATKSKWSHVWIEYPSGVWGGRWVAHAWAGGVVKIPLEQVEAAYPIRKVYECRVCVNKLMPGFDWARQYIGAKYDYGVVWNGLMLVLYRATGWKRLWKMLIRNSSKLSCSEFASGFLKAAGVDGTKGLDPEFTTPGILDEFCSGSDDFLV